MSNPTRQATPPDATAPMPRKPAWLRVRLGGDAAASVRTTLDGLHLHTVCQEALCPNLGACWEGRHATFMLLGAVCTRGCRFCNVVPGRPQPPDPDEPARVAEAVRRLGLREVVLTSVTRDDLPDGGATAWATTIRAVRAANPGLTIETLIPDFAGQTAALDQVLAAAPDILGHNLETVPRLYPAVRSGADYNRSLRLLRHAADAGARVKTALMLGLGETPDEVRGVMRDARAAGCAILFLGHYLQPSRAHTPVVRYLETEAFAAFKADAEVLGFPVVVAGPLVRSSFHSAEQARYLRSKQ